MATKTRCPRCGHWTKALRPSSRRLTKEGREAISRAAKRRWAAWRKAKLGETKKAGVRRQIAAR